MAGGKLPRLPYSGSEVQWVAKAFQDAGIKAGVFTGASATEAGVRYWAPGRKVLHLACHGLTDQSLGNFYGALALTPGPRRRRRPGRRRLPDAGGDLRLNLKGCELAILSACQTNYGPQQKGEGTWALSRGFLVAGARRVVASNWLVDDEAAASLVSIYCTLLAKAERQGGPVDYAAVAARGQALGAEAGEVEGPLLLGQPRPRRAALTPGRASTARRRPRSAGREPRP